MPLTARKIAHIQAKQDALFQGRAQSIYLTCKRADGTTYQLTIQGIWREMADFDPVLDEQSLSENDANLADVHALFKASDITLQQLRSCIYATVDASPNATATRFRLTSIAIKGMQPGGNRYYTTWNRQR
jgi:hypothetical protein